MAIRRFPRLVTNPWSATLLLVLAPAPSALCQTVPAAEPAVTTGSRPATASPTANSAATTPPAAHRLIRNLVLQHVPPTYENTKKWGGTKRVWDGLHVSLDGLRLKTKRRWKDAKHGTWKHYRAWLIDPDEEFAIRIEKMVSTPAGKTAFDVVIDARLGAWGRLSEYARDVQLLSLSAEADARVRMRASCEMSLRLDATRFPPDVILEPEVVSAELTLLEFELVRISDLDGPLVREFGEELHDVLQEEIADRQTRLVDKLNRQLKKHEDDLRLSVADLASSGLRQLQDVSERDETRP